MRSADGRRRLLPGRLQPWCGGRTWARRRRLLEPAPRVGTGQAWTTPPAPPTPPCWLGAEEAEHRGQRVCWAPTVYRGEEALTPPPLTLHYTRTPVEAREAGGQGCWTHPMTFHTFLWRGPGSQPRPPQVSLSTDTQMPSVGGGQASRDLSEHRTFQPASQVAMDGPPLLPLRECFPQYPQKRVLNPTGVPTSTTTTPT